MSAPGTFKEKVTLEPMVPAEQLKYAAFEVELEITVEGDPTAAVVAEIPMASEIICGQPLSDSTLTGGRVVKNGEDIPGTFAWKNPTIVPRKDEKCTVVFTPNDTTVCEPIEIDIPVNANLIPIEITEWPAVKCQYIVDGFIRECAVLEGGKANVPGEFKIDMDYFARIPADTKITDTFEVKVTFRPTSYDYDEVSKMIAVEFLPCDPNINISAEPKPNGKKGEIVVDGAVVNKANWDQHTGKFYYVLDGVSTEIDDYRFYNEYSCDNLAVGTHMAYCKYIPGENDVYAPFKTEEITFEIIGYYDVIVTDCTGTYVDGNYCAGRRIDAHAAPHENSYYEFTGWTVEGAEITEHNGLENAALYFTMPEGEVHLTANYKFNFKLFLEYSFTKVVVWLKDVVGKIFGGVTI